MRAGAKQHQANVELCRNGRHPFFFGSAALNSGRWSRGIASRVVCGNPGARSTGPAGIDVRAHGGEVIALLYVHMVLLLA